MGQKIAATAVLLFMVAFCFWLCVWTVKDWLTFTGEK